MINLFRFILRNSHFFLFIVFEAIAFYLIVNYNRTQKDIFLKSSNVVTATILKKYDSIDDYFHLAEINKRVNEENAILLKQISRLKEKSGESPGEFSFASGKVISNQIHGRYNRFLIDKGSQDNVRKGMGVISNQVPVGIVQHVTQKYAQVQSLLNVDVNISAKIKNKQHFGLLNWSGVHPKQAVLNHIPTYAEVSRGDSVVTAGYSYVFPPDLPIGIVEEVEVSKGSNLLEIRVKLFADLNRLEFIQVIENENRAILDSLNHVMN